MKRGVFLLFLVLFLPSSLALTDKVIYNGWVLAGRNLTLFNETYRIDYVNWNNATIVSFPEGIAVVIYANTQNCSSEWIYTVCQTKQKFEKGGLQTIPFANSQNINVSLFLKINKTEIGVDLSRNVTPSIIYLEDTINVKASLENSLGADFQEVFFVDRFPDSFYIQEVTGCIQNGSSVFWRGKLDDKRKIYCTYKIKPLYAGIFKSVGFVSYDVLGKTYIRSINNTYDIKTGPFNFYINTSNNSLKTGYVVLVNLTIIGQNDFFINELKVELPSYFKIINTSDDLRVMQNILFYENKEMKKGDKKASFFIVASDYVNIDKTNVSLSYTYSDMKRESKKEIIINYTAILPSLYFYKLENHSVLRVSNPNNISYRKLVVSFENFSFELDFLDKWRYKEFDFPLLNETKHSFNISYFSYKNQPLNGVFELKYGESTGDKNLKLSEQPNEKNKKNETIFQPTKKRINIDPKLLLFSLGGIAVFAILLFLISFIKSKNHKSNLDKEIEKIKKEIEKE